MSHVAVGALVPPAKGVRGAASTQIDPQDRLSSKQATSEPKS